MPETDTVIIGAGHAGLAMSRCLTGRAVPNVVLERGRVGERWRSARWDSFLMLTPNWLSRLPGWEYTGPDPDGFMTAAEFVDHLARYARSFAAPVEEQTAVTRVVRDGARFAVHTDRGTWRACRVVVASGYHSQACVPDLARGLDPGIAQVTPSGYRSPASLPDGAVLVVGASASGAQIAQELARAGRTVYVSVGSHSRLPRRYRGRDIMWWLDRIGTFDRTIDEAADPERSRTEPSLQLAGSATGRRLDLGVLQELGVRLAGRLRTVQGTVADFSPDLAGTMAAAQQRLVRVLASVDAYAETLSGPVPPADPPPPIAVPGDLSRLDLQRAGITSVMWATGYRPRYPWLAAPALDDRGRIRHRRGVTAVPGLYAIGLRFQHRRSSTFVDGARHDAAYLAEHIAASRTERIVA
jgi:putative flavoprotein involved in K+ transport